jgi:flagellar basal-body rod protein FlgB
MDKIGFKNQTLMDKTARLLSHMLDYRTKNHGVIAGNLANIDTPGYRPKELEFDAELKRAISNPDIPLKRTDRRHLPITSERILAGEPSFSRHKLTSFGEADDLDMDREMAKMSQNNLLYEATVRLLSKKFEALRLAIEGRRR